jgi:hypothetical protein
METECDVRWPRPCPAALGGTDPVLTLSLPPPSPFPGTLCSMGWWWLTTTTRCTWCVWSGKSTATRGGTCGGRRPSSKRWKRIRRRSSCGPISPSFGLRSTARACLGCHSFSHATGLWWVLGTPSAELAKLRKMNAAPVPASDTPATEAAPAPAPAPAGPAPSAAAASPGRKPAKASSKAAVPRPRASGSSRPD